MYNEQQNDESNRNALIRALKTDDVETVKKIFDSSPDLFNDATMFYYIGKYNAITVARNISADVDFSISDDIALSSACEYGHLDLVKFLCSLPNVNPSSCNNAPIHWASYKKHLEIVRFLLTLPGVEIDAEDNSAIDIARIFNRNDVAQFFEHRLFYGE
jgi:ankyrin repeat protein